MYAEDSERPAMYVTIWRDPQFAVPKRIVERCVDVAYLNTVLIVVRIVNIQRGIRWCLGLGLGYRTNFNSGDLEHSITVLPKLGLLVRLFN